MAEIGCKATVPTEIYGWFAINKLLRLDSTDVAMVKAQAQSYKLDDVMPAMRKMRGGDRLSLRDAETKKQGNHSKTFAAILEPTCASTGHVGSEAAWMKMLSTMMNLMLKTPWKKVKLDLNKSQMIWRPDPVMTRSIPTSRNPVRLCTRKLGRRWTSIVSPEDFIQLVEKGKDRKRQGKDSKEDACGVER